MNLGKAIEEDDQELDVVFTSSSVIDRTKKQASLRGRAASINLTHDRLQARHMVGCISCPLLACTGGTGHSR